MLIQYREGSFRTLGAMDGLPNGSAFRIDEGDDGDLWVTWVETTARGGSVTQHTGTQISTYHPGDFPFDVRPTPGRPSGPNDLWWTRDSAGLHCLRRGIVSPCASAEALPDREVIRVSEDHRGNVWILFDDGELLQVSASGHRHLKIDDGLRAPIVLWDPPESGPAPTAYVLNVTGAYVGSFPTPTRALNGVVGPGMYGLSVQATNACGASSFTPEQAVTVP